MSTSVDDGGPATLVDELRLRASVLTQFEVEWLGLDAAEDADIEVAGFLLTEAKRVAPASAGRPEDGQPRWRVGDDVRRSSAENGLASLRAAWRSVTHRPESDLQRMIDRLIGRGEGVDLARMSRSDLPLVAQVSRWFEAVGTPVPPHRDVDARLRFEAMLDPLRAVATDNFKDRTDQLARLERIGADDPPTLLIGRGGIGKSALLAHYLLRCVDRGDRICYLNFDHSALDPVAPATLVAEMASQLSWQVTATRSARLRSLADEAVALVRHGDSASASASRDVNVRAESWDGLLATIAYEVSDRPVVVAFDTVEEAQRRDWDLRSLRRLFDGLRHHMPRGRVVASGRGDVTNLTDQRIVLEGLPTDDAVALLDTLLRDPPADTSIELERDAIGEVVELIGSSPLCVRLAAGILRSTSGDERWLRNLELRQGVLEGELYRRLLEHIEDPAVRRIAFPGLTLRRVTPEIVREVLARPCKVRVTSAARAQQLFDGLAREAMLVERLEWNVLVHRSDIRPLMLDQLAADNEVDVRKIHRAAIRYYRAFDDRESRVEELYHRLMLGQSPRTLDGRWRADVAADLQAVADEVPAASRAYLLDKLPELEARFSTEEIAEIDVARQRPVIERQVQRLVANGDLSDAAEVLASARTPSGEPLLPVVELQVRELLGDLDQASAIAAAEEDRLAARGDVAGVVELAMHRARLWQQSGDAPRAARHLAALSARLDRLGSPAVDDVLRLRLVVSQLRLDRYDAGIDDRGELVDAAVAIFDRTSRSQLARAPALLRDLVGELDVAAPVELLTLALRSGGLEDHDGSVAAGLVEFDGEVSKSRGRDHGVLADVAQVATKGDGPADWENWMSSEGSSTVGGRVGSIIDEFEAEVPDRVKESIAKQYRDDSDRANDYRG